MITVSSRIAGRYRIDARLGGGGMADVYDGYDEALDRQVAVKLLRGIDDEASAKRFAEEIRLTARVNHPNIVRLFDAGVHDGAPFLVLERVSGGTLAGEMAAGPMDPLRVAVIGEQIAAALAHSHAAGIVHRDVKPTNVLLTNDGAVRLADFGIAITATATRLTMAGTVAGSAGYVAPEQVLGEGAAGPADVYALGLVLLECLTGGPPWSGTTVEVALARITADPPIPTDLGEGWAPLLRSMTARDPDARAPIMLVGLALEQLAAGRPLSTGVFEAPTTPSDPRLPALTGMSVLLLLVAALSVLTQGDIARSVPLAPVVSFNLPAAEVSLATPVPATAVAAPTAAPAAAQRRTQRATSERRVADRRERRSTRPSAGTTDSSATAERDDDATVASSPLAPLRDVTKTTNTADRSDLSVPKVSTDLVTSAPDTSTSKTSSNPDTGRGNGLEARLSNAASIDKGIRIPKPPKRGKR